jgi:hypothetical protein
MGLESSVNDGSVRLRIGREHERGRASVGVAFRMRQLVVGASEGGVVRCSQWRAGGPGG